MAKKTKIPGPLERRHLIERAMGSEAARALAEAYVAEGRVWEAVAFLVKADARDRIAELRDEATDAGDTFLVRELARALGEEPTPERWIAVEQAARSAGKERFAGQAQRLADRQPG